MCHLLLLLPILALAVLWFLPPAVSVPIYAIIAVLSVALYVAALRAMRKPVVTGKEQILRATGVVVSAESEALVVRVQGERWTARSADQSLRPGDGVRVIGIDGLVLRVARDTDESAPPVQARVAAHRAE